MSASAGDPSAPSRLLHLAETDSTNAEAMRRALAGEPPPFWVVADRQTSGRGRSGRAWASQPGNLFASLLVSIACSPARAGQLSLVAGVAAIDAIRKAAAQGVPAGLRLKWPNDILIGAAKTGGILVESTTTNLGAERLAVMGIGLNLASAPVDLGRSATFLSAHGLSLSPLRALCFLAEAMDGWLKTWNDARGFAAVREAWLKRAGPIGEPLTVHTGGGLVSGRFAGLDEEGALVIAGPDGTERRFTYGDVMLGEPAGGTAEQKKDEGR
jgi:BirA family transcriptional regulator, biotin operon repressor / biotin---[acetyl-CoA-carboxylase] ligase